MQIGIIGSGDVAQNLGEGLVKAGHKVMLGTRNPEKRQLKHWRKKKDHHRSVGSTTEAANFGEVCVLAVAWHATEDVLAQIRPELAGKVVIDVTNPLIFQEDGPPVLSVGHTISGGEIVQQSLPDSHVVKSLNFISFRNMAKPHFKSGIPIMFVCGNNQSAKNTCGQLLLDLGWSDLMDLGGIEKSRLLEPLSLLWIEYGVNRVTWSHAFAVLRD
jgi:8-hydroxy-5-deazaflavin:NADPH oxidoreductase